MQNLRVCLSLISAVLLWILLLVSRLFLPQTGVEPEPTVVSGSTRGIVVFAMSDPSNDDYGPGPYRYPQSEVFAPFTGLFDLRFFEVWYDAQHIYFDLTFAQITNPWQAPEGFFHQLIDIYINTEPGGRTSPLNPGVGVQFAPDYGWQYFVRGMAWGGSRVYAWAEQKLSTWQKGVTAQLLPDKQTIRILVPRPLLPTPTNKWRYYVLIGAYDGFGPDNYRDVARTQGEWHFGGGTGSRFDPRVLDLLAPGKGQYTQEKMLANAKARRTYPVVYPVGASLMRRVPPYLWWLVALLLGGAIFDLYRLRLRHLPKNNGRD